MPGLSSGPGLTVSVQEKLEAEHARLPALLDRHSVGLGRGGGPRHGLLGNPEPLDLPSAWSGASGRPASRLGPSFRRRPSPGAAQQRYMNRHRFFLKWLGRAAKRNSRLPGFSPWMPRDFGNKRINAYGMYKRFSSVTRGTFSTFVGLHPTYSADTSDESVEGNAASSAGVLSFSIAGRFAPMMPWRSPHIPAVCVAARSSCFSRLAQIR